MSLRVALLRGINVGGKNLVAMADLRGLLVDLECGNPRSLLQSGNLVFESDRGDAELEELLQRESETRLGLKTQYFVRSRQEIEAVIRDNPFEDMARDDPGHLLVLFMKSGVVQAKERALQSAVKGREAVRILGRHAYISYPDGIGTSKLTIQVIEKHVECAGTGRNWNTVLKLASACRQERS